ncbi:hypothetical protein CEXT_521981 [Caerostris extrusa]|uniref:Uncharacterized protein n=1 Tax=Caerostris extrusa TaxID=172846 RepID=A0AAV4Q139_CAEEX|nr:hypothetical protein CEXT_521981 [Caerostris extrusa]
MRNQGDQTNVWDDSCPERDGISHFFHRNPDSGVWFQSLFVFRDDLTTLIASARNTAAGNQQLTARDPIPYIPFIKRHHRPCGVIWLTHNPHSEEAP